MESMESGPQIPAAMWPNVAAIAQELDRCRNSGNKLGEAVATSDPW